MTNATLKEKLKYGLYKYVYDGKIIYIGKSDRATVGSGIPQRIKDHTREAKFQPYLDKAEIFYMSMNDCVDEIDANETLLIKQYAPVLNVSDKPSKKSAQNYEAALLKTHKWEPFRKEYLCLNDDSIIKKKKIVVNSQIASTPKRNHLLEIDKSLSVYKWIYNQILLNQYTSKIDMRLGLIFNIPLTEDCPDITFMPLTGEGFADNYEFYHTNWVCTLHKNKNKDNEYIYTVITRNIRKNIAASTDNDVITGIKNSIITLEVAYKNIFFKENSIKDIIGFGAYIYDLGSLIQKNQSVVDLCYYLQDSFKFNKNIEYCGSKDNVRYEITNSEYIKSRKNISLQDIPLPKIKIHTLTKHGTIAINTGIVYNEYKEDNNGNGHYYLPGYDYIKDDVSKIIDIDVEMKLWYELLDEIYKNVA